MRLNNRFGIIISAGCLLASCVFSCQQEKNREWDANNPNLPSSPLAAVMREIAETMEAAKPKIGASEMVILDKDLFSEIKTSSHTNQRDNNLKYYALSDGFLGILDEYEKSPGIATFNNLVEGCISCHKNFCEGPIARIKKMKI